jgi:hypothetical protein
VRLLTDAEEACQLGTLNVNAALFETAVLPEVLGVLKVLEDKAKKGVFVPCFS